MSIAPASYDTAYDAALVLTTVAQRQCTLKMLLLDSLLCKKPYTDTKSCSIFVLWLIANRLSRLTINAICSCTLEAGTADALFV
jgi:hypothetical protein